VRPPIIADQPAALVSGRLHGRRLPRSAFNELIEKVLVALLIPRTARMPVGRQRFPHGRKTVGMVGVAWYPALSDVSATPVPVGEQMTDRLLDAVQCIMDSRCSSNTLYGISTGR